MARITTVNATTIYQYIRRMTSEEEGCNQTEVIPVMHFSQKALSNLKFA